MMLYSFVCGCACMRMSCLPPVAHVSGAEGNWILCWGGVSCLIEHIDVEIVAYFQAKRWPPISFGPAVPLAVSLQNLTHASLSEAAGLTWRWCCSVPQSEVLFTYFFSVWFYPDETMVQALHAQAEWLTVKTVVQCLQSFVSEQIPAKHLCLKICVP